MRCLLFKTTPLESAFLVELDRHEDGRGFFARTFCETEFSRHGLPTHFPQCNLSHNLRSGTLRGMHFNAAPHAESKLVRCVSGAIYDVIVDLRAGSSTRFEWFGVELSQGNGSALFIPAGFAHGFVTLTDDADVFYHMGEFFHAEAARGFRWNDPKFAIRWPSAPVVISERDATYPDFHPDAVGG
jgi:dTDP-4-dehydrorhamnose 3,5-epimerase